MQIFIFQEEITVAISYNKLWKLLIDKKMSQAELRKAANIAPNTMTKLRRDEPVNMAILERACAVLECDFGDIVEFIPDIDNWFNKGKVLWINNS